MQTTAVVVGAGHAGLAVSHCLAARGIDHVVIERGEVAHTWRTERWDSLRLLTPNWQTRVPGLAYDGDDPDGFMTMAEVVAFIERYARLVAPPLETGTTVESLASNGDGYDVVTDRGVWQCRAVAIASGGFNVPKLPTVAAALPGAIESVTPMDYTAALGAAGRRRAGGGRVRHGRSDRGRGSPLRAARDARGGRARPYAAHLPRQGHLVVDGPHRAARREIRRGRRHRPRAPGSVAPARGHARTGDAEYQQPHRSGGAAGGLARRVRGRQGAVLRLAPQQVHARRPEAGPAARHHRRMGGRERARRWRWSRRTASRRRGWRSRRR